jgi:splicing factor U2AF subunit
MLRTLQVALNGRFAFVEFRVPEYATAALQLNGQIALMGNTLKIARPASYVEMPVRAAYASAVARCVITWCSFRATEAVAVHHLRIPAQQVQSH